MEDIKYGQLWARYGELVEQRHLGTYRISFEGLKKAINEAMSARYPQPGAVWVKATVRLPGWDELVEWRFAGKEPTAKETVKFLFSAANLHQWEWLDESNEQPVEQKENDAVLKWFFDNRRGLVHTGSIEQLTELYSEYQKQKDVNP